MTDCFFIEKKVAFVHLGRFGDIMLMLPAFKYISDKTGIPTSVYVSSDFASIFDGVSYVQPIVLNKFNWYKDVAKARDIAEKSFDVVIIPKWWDIPGGKPPGENPHAPKVKVTNWAGSTLVEKSKWNSYMISQWEAAGFTESQLMEWPLIFDRRDAEREAALVAQWKRGTKPLLLVNFSGITSKLKWSHEVMRMVSIFRGSFDILDIGSIRAHRIYDMLGLYDIAAGLITIDTSTLHLAAASRVPTIALIADGGGGSVVKGNSVLTMRYSEILKNKHKIVNALEKILKGNLQPA